MNQNVEIIYAGLGYHEIKVSNDESTGTNPQVLINGHKLFTGISAWREKDKGIVESGHLKVAVWFNGYEKILILENHYLQVQHAPGKIRIKLEKDEFYKDLVKVEMILKGIND